MDLSSLLKHIVAYVEVRSSNDNRSAAICKEIEQLGAQVRCTFSDDVTHVVFKEGSKRTWNKAMKRNIPLVSVSWLDSCRQNGQVMPEKDFPVILPEEINSPLPRMNQGPRWKKMKSMQPCEFDEMMAKSSERVEKRRKREQMANRFKVNFDSTPTSSSPLPILALDTQGLLPFSTYCSPVPETPSSLKERLDRMLRERKQVLEMDEEVLIDTPKQQCAKSLQRRLFGGELFTSSSDEDLTTSRNVQGLIASMKSSSSSNLTPDTITTPGKQQALSPRSNNLVVHAALMSPETSNKLSSNNLCLSSSSKRALLLKSPLRKVSALENDAPHLDSSKTSDRKQITSVKLLSPQNLQADMSTVAASKPLTNCDPANQQAYNLNPKAQSLSTLICNEEVENCSITFKQTDNERAEKNGKKESTVRKNSRNSTIGNQSTERKDDHKNEDCEKEKIITDLAPLEPKLTRKKKLFGQCFKNRFFDAEAEPVTQNKINNKPLLTSKNLDDSLASAKADASFLFSIGTSDSNIKNSPRNLKSKPAKSVLNISRKKSLLPDLDLTVDRASQDKSCTETIQPSYTQEDSTQLLESSMSVMYPSETSHSTSRRRSARLSINEFSLKKSQAVRPAAAKEKLKCVASTGIKKRRADTNKQLNKSNDDDSLDGANRSHTKRKRNSSDSSSRSSDKKRSKKCDAVSAKEKVKTKLNSSSAADTEEGTTSKLRHARSLIMAKPSVITKKTAYSLVMTSLHRQEQEIICSVVKQFGVFDMTHNVDAHTSHVVCGDARRTLNILRAIARGCWVLCKEWVLESLDAGEWLLEEKYEMVKEFPAAKKSRHQRENMGPGYKLDLFSKVGPIYVHIECTPPREELVNLINLCCGHVTGSQTRASLFVGDSHDPKRLVIHPTWILDSIMKFECLKPADYIVPAPTQQQRESSPEF